MRQRALDFASGSRQASWLAPMSGSSKPTARRGANPMAREMRTILFRGDATMSSLDVIGLNAPARLYSSTICSSRTNSRTPRRTCRAA